MYLTKSQLDFLLQDPYYSEPMTQSVFTYKFYRGKFNATVHTLRLHWDVEENRIHQFITNYLMSNFTLNSSLLVSVSYDLVLCQPNTESFYIWRSNSNLVNFNEATETKLILNYNNLYRFLQTIKNIHIPSLNTNFEQSNVIIFKPLALVMSVIKI